MFARYLIGDLFIHGIGGAKYDELGDEIASRFFGFEPPTYLTVFDDALARPRDRRPSGLGTSRLASAERGLRDLTYNPDRHLAGPERIDPPPESARWVRAKRAAIAGPVATHAQRLARFHEIRRCNLALQAQVAAERERLIADRERLAAGVNRNALAHNREFSLVLHSERRLREAMNRAAVAEEEPSTGWLLRVSESMHSDLGGWGKRQRTRGVRGL